jgi:hypothetical protein
MKNAKSEAKAAGMSDAAVRRATGKGWPQWFAVLDRFDVRKNGHAAAARHLHEKHRVPGWWAQMVTVGYEQARGLRKPHQRPEGYSVSASKTFAAPVGALFRAWSHARLRRRWLTGRFAVTTARRNKSLRILWGKGPTRVDVNFYPKAPRRCTMTVQHSKVPSAKTAQNYKACWRRALARLDQAVAGD